MLGKVRVPQSKSIANRAMPLALLANGETVLRGFRDQQNPEDICLMLDALRALSVQTCIQGNDLHIAGTNSIRAIKPIHAGEAGTVLRFALPLAAFHCQGPVQFKGSERLFLRPLKPLLDALSTIGAKWHPEANGGVLTPPSNKPQFAQIEAAIPKSSQFISGLAIAIAGLPKGGTINWAGQTASRSFIELTQRWLQKFQCNAHLGENSFEIPGGSLRALSVGVPGDWSAAASIFCAAAVLGRQVTVYPLSQTDGQPDAAILQILESAGSAWHFEEDRCHFRGRLNTGYYADLTNCPDLAPVLAATATLAPGISELSGLSALPYKESDRLEGIIDLAEWLGGRAEEISDFRLRIHPRKTARMPFSDKPFDPRGDHRMAFAAAVGGLRNGGALLDPCCVAKSFPGFWEAWEGMLGDSPR